MVLSRTISRIIGLKIIDFYKLANKFNPRGMLYIGRVYPLSNFWSSYIKTSMYRIDEFGNSIVGGELDGEEKEK